MAKSYKPINDKEALEFMKQWCFRCAKEVRGESITNKCHFFCATMICDLDEDGYPSGWVCEKDGPSCSNFVPKDIPNIEENS